MRFDLGRVVVTPRASEALRAGGLKLEDLLNRHQSGDWGNVSDQTAEVNARAVQNGFALVSAYDMPTGERVTVFTRPDRTYTLVHVARETPQDKSEQPVASAAES